MRRVRPPPPPPTGSAPGYAKLTVTFFFTYNIRDNDMAINSACPKIVITTLVLALRLGSLGFAYSQTTGFESKTFHERVLSGNKSPVVSQGYQRCRESHSENILEHVMIVTQCLT